MRPILESGTKAIVDGTIIVEIDKYKARNDEYLVDTGYGKMWIAAEHLEALA
jgi:hypothetical protein